LTSPIRLSFRITVFAAHQENGQVEDPKIHGGLVDPEKVGS